MNFARWLALLSAMAVVLSLASCKGSGKTKVAFVTNNPNPFWSIAEAGARKAADEEDVELDFQRPSGGSAAKQKEIVDALVVQGVAAISVSVIDPKNQREYLEGVAAKVPLICVDNDLEIKTGETTKRLCYLGTDNIKAGRAVGELVEKALPGGGKISFFVGDFAAVNARERYQGTVDYLRDVEKKKSIKYAIFGDADSERPFLDGASDKVAKEKADFVLNILKDEPNLCLIGLWNSNPPAIYKAVQAKNLESKVKIVGFDEHADTLAGVKAGHIEGTVVQDPYKFGYESVKLMAKISRGDRSGVPANGNLFVPFRVITRDNVDSFQSDLNTKLGK